MSANKRLNTSYTLTTVNSGDSVTLDTSLVTVTGNLVVLGVQTVVESTTTTVVDPIITLNQGESGTGVTSGYSGIEIDRGLATNVQFRWNESAQAWQVSNASGTFANIGGLATDSAPVLSGNLDVKNFQIYNSLNSVVHFNDNVAIATTSVAPGAISNNVVVYGSTVGGGGSGLYTATASGNNELATKSAAIKYSIIFG
jgi:hypothetical protein